MMRTSLKYPFVFPVLIVLLMVQPLAAQVTFPVNGIPDQRKTYHAFVNARIYSDYQTVADSLTMIVYDNTIYAIGKDVKIPDGAVVHNMEGKTIYPSFIDPDTQYGIAETPAGEKPKGQQMQSNTKGAFSWNQALKPETEAARLFSVNDNQAEAYRNAGFGTVLTYNHDGIARGTAALVLLSGKKEHEVILRDKAAACYSFKKGTSTQDYPTSEMGAIALLRQSFLDADWYRNGGSRTEYNISLESWIANMSVPQLFESDNKFQSLRIDKVGDEFGVNFIIKGSGDEYQRLKEIGNTGNTFIVPLNFPRAYDVADPYDAINVSLGELKHWEMAPANPYLMDQAGVPIAFTASGLKDPSIFPEQMRKVIAYGLSPTAALKALTHTPARILGVADRIGALKKGMLANFIVTTGNVFDKRHRILENWIGGVMYRINEGDISDIRGRYNLTFSNRAPMKLEVFGPLHDLKASVGDGADSIPATTTFSNGIIGIRYETKRDSASGSYMLSGFRKSPGKNHFSGTGTGPSGQNFSWEAVYAGASQVQLPPDTASKENPSWGTLLYPNKAYGSRELPVAETVLFKGATVWTNEAEGILMETDVLLSAGKILKIGKNLDHPGAIIIDGKGRHLTAGIIDEHSHIAVSGSVNECSHAVTSEVRIGDVIDSDNINIYRQLAGGVTTSQLLHGSCNPIGGQSALIKLRWGRSPEEMKFEGAAGFIKFALGENVKQSNFGDEYKSRYPQTRMGVEQVYVNAFRKAIEYAGAFKSYNPKNKSAVKPRRDLRLDALVEILENKRFITCHSYQQGEINMLMHVADSMGFRINTFTHILEGYKVADKMKRHGAGAAAFSDWWGYKFEVIEAIPHNGSILHEMGLVTAFNSDDPEMARRLNQEAAKAVLYGGVSEEEALKFVTLNPAKLLHIDDRVGSIKTGKDADVVLWNGHPLSVYSKPLMTFVDGVRYFDVQQDEVKRKEIETERARLISKMMKEKGRDGGRELKKPEFRQEQVQHCMEDEEND